MIVTGKVSLPRVVLNLWRPLTFVFAVAVVVTALHEKFAARWIAVETTPFTVVGLALSIFIGFRNNTVYSRYWEARTLWGALINASRTLARQLVTYVAPVDPGESAEARAFVREVLLRHIGFVHAFRHHLRNDEPCVALDPYVAPDELEQMRRARNVPSAVLHRQGERLHDAWRRGWIRDLHLTALDQTMTDVTNVLGGCERIKNTPIPPVYTYLAHLIIVGYCSLLPFGMVAVTGLFTPLVVLCIGFAFLILDRISFLIETPFGMRVNDLPLGAMSRTIEIDLLQRLGEPDVPEPAKPDQGVLL
jgi:putative membrane protein